jgi:hypothetical protein
MDAIGMAALAAAALALLAVSLLALRLSRRRRSRDPIPSHDLGWVAGEPGTTEVGEALGRKAQRDTLAARALAPTAASAGQTFRIWTVIGPPRKVESLSRQRAKQIGGEASLPEKFTEKVKRGARIDVVLTGAALSDAHVVPLRWQGRPLEASFQVKMPPTFDEAQALFDVSFFVDRICVGVIPLSVRLEASKPATPAEAVLSVPRHVFISYSSHDRDTAISIARAYERIGVAPFLDVLKIRGGDLWEERLAEEIDRCDAMYLLWSQHAADSEYVRWEVKRALDRRLVDPARRPSIFTHIIGDPPPAQWPAELGRLQFNDPLLALWNQNLLKARLQDQGTSSPVS